MQDTERPASPSGTAPAAGSPLAGPMRPTTTSLSPSSRPPSPPARLPGVRHVPALVVAALVVAGACAALNLDVVRDGGGVKGDEATYVSMALSVAYDGDLLYTRRDLARFYSLYHAGPEGLFLKRGSHLEVSLRASWPFVRAGWVSSAESRSLAFGKAFPYAVAAAPFVRLFGLNGLLLFNVVLLGGVLGLAIRFLMDRADPITSLAFAAAFIGASITPIYLVWLTPEIFNFALVFFGYYLWGRHARENETQPSRRRAWAAAGAAALIAVASFSKPLNLLLIGPPVVWYVLRRRLGTAAIAAGVFGLVLLALVGTNVIVSGDANYQGGDRKTFYGSFPFQSSDDLFGTVGSSMTTNRLDALDRPEPNAFWPVLGHNLVYFFVGRHSGLALYYFPGLVALALFLWNWRRARLWQWLALAALAASVLATLVVLPFSWSGGGGPPGNRYFLNFYPVLFFLLPPLRSLAPAAVSWTVGTLLVGHVLVNPFIYARQTWEIQAPRQFHLFPIELTMVNDLPVMLNQAKARVPYGHDPTVFLYFLDDNAYTPEPAGFWVAGRSHTEVIVRSDRPIPRFSVTLRSPVKTTVRVRMGGPARTAVVEPGGQAVFVVHARGVHSRWSEAYVLEVSCDNGFVPRLVEPGSTDNRFLGVQVTLAPVLDPSDVRSVPATSAGGSGGVR